MIQLGDMVKDQVSGFKGIVTAQIVYITGCVQYKVQPSNGLGLKSRLGVDGKVLEPEWFDEAQLDAEEIATSIAHANARIMGAMGGPFGGEPSSQHP